MGESLNDAIRLALEAEDADEDQAHLAVLADVVEPAVRRWYIDWLQKQYESSDGDFDFVMWALNRDGQDIAPSETDG